MKKIFFLVLVIPFIIYPQTFTSLMGFEDSLGSTQLFYRIGTYEWNSHVYHLNISNGTDTLFYYLKQYDRYIIDFDFWNNNPSLHIRIGGSFRFTGSGGIYKYNGSSFGGEHYYFDQLDISKQDTNLLYSGGHYYEHLPIPVDFNFVLKSTDAGDTWSITDTNKYFVSLNPFDDTQFFVLDDSTKLFKTTDAGLTFIEVDTTRNESFWAMLLKFFYDKDSVHIYRISIDDEGYYLSVSNNKGDINTGKLYIEGVDPYILLLIIQVQGIFI